MRVTTATFAAWQATASRKFVSILEKQQGKLQPAIGCSHHLHQKQQLRIRGAAEQQALPACGNFRGRQSRCGGPKVSHFAHPVSTPPRTASRRPFVDRGKGKKPQGGHEPTHMHVEIPKAKLS